MAVLRWDTPAHLPGFRKRIADIVQIIRSEAIEGLKSSPYALTFLISPQRNTAKDRWVVEQLLETIKEIKNFPPMVIKLLTVLMVRPFYRNGRKRATDYGQHYRLLKELMNLSVFIRSLPTNSEFTGIIEETLRQMIGEDFSLNRIRRSFDGYDCTKPLSSGGEEVSF
jgi:hypothetical protein